jgi:hypothetical protein
VWANNTNVLSFIRAIRTFAAFAFKLLPSSEDYLDGKSPLDGSVATA